MYGRHRDESPWLAGPLEEAGLLRVLEPSEFVDGQVTSDLFQIIIGLLEAGAFDDLKAPSPYGYAELSRSRLGWNADLALSEELIEELLVRELARPGEDGVSVPLHPIVRTTVLVLLSQLAPAAGRRAGLDLLPVTPSRDRISDLIRFLALPTVNSAAEVVAIDVETVGLDLSAVPVEAVLEFRGLHGAEHQRYMRGVRTAIRVLSTLDHEERESALIERQEEFADEAASLRRTGRAYWRRPMARVAVGGAGAVVSLATGGLLPAALGGLAALLEWEPQPSKSGPFSYLFELQRSIGG
jgi:hypothetical protein